jgi:hypothetical protein
MRNWEWKFLQKEITGTQTNFSTNFGGKLSFILSFVFPERLHCCYIYTFTAPTCTTTIITLEPCALNAEFQHFITRFHHFADTTERGDRGAKAPIGRETEGDFTDNSNITCKIVCRFITLVITIACYSFFSQIGVFEVGWESCDGTLCFCTLFSHSFSCF